MNIKQTSLWECPASQVWSDDVTTENTHKINRKLSICETLATRLEDQSNQPDLAAWTFITFQINLFKK